MRNFLLIIVCLFNIWEISAQRSAQELKKANKREKDSIDSLGWKKHGFFVFNINQAALNDWSTGGESFMIGINGILNYSVHHKMGKYTFDSYIDMELGVVEAASFKKFRKTTDRFDLTLEMEHSMGKNLNYGLLFNCNTQLFGGHNYSLADHNKISSFLSPGKILLAPGIDLKRQKPMSYFSLFVSPATFRWVTKLDDEFYDQLKFGVDSAHKVNTEIGAYLSIHFDAKIKRNAEYIARLDLFSNYKRNPEYVDVLLNNLFTINISNFFAATIILDIIYDHDIKASTQVQEIFGLGLKLKL